MIRDPNTKREDGNPKCFSHYEEGHFVCENKCNKALSCRMETAEEEQRREGKTLKDASGRPVCFGKIYSPLSTECNFLCNVAYDCAEETETNERKRTALKTSPYAKRSELLTMYQPSPYSYNNRPQTPGIFQQPQTGVYQYQVDDRTNAYLRQKHGVGLKIDPTVPGQFEGEAWYERFLKEVFKYAGVYALQLLALAVSQSRWAPNAKHNDGQ